MAESDKSARREYGERLKAYRMAADLTQEKVATGLGVDQSYIAAIETGKVNLSIDSQVRIAEFFGVKFFNIPDPDKEIPSKQTLRESISEYLKAHETDPSYLYSKSVHYTTFIDNVLNTDFLLQIRSAKEISDEIIRLDQVKIKPERITDVLTRSPRQEQLHITKAKGNRNRYQLKNKP